MIPILGAVCHVQAHVLAAAGHLLGRLYMKVQLLIVVCSKEWLSLARNKPWALTATIILVHKGSWSRLGSCGHSLAPCIRFTVHASVLWLPAGRPLTSRMAWSSSRLQIGG